MTRLRMLAAPALIAALGLTVAMPAQARDYRADNSYHHANSYRHAATQHTSASNTAIARTISEVSRDIDRAAARRTISAREASALRKDASQLQKLHAQYARNGLTRTELRTLENRVDRLRLALRADMRGSSRRRG